MINKILSIDGKKAKRKTANDAKCWNMLRELVSEGEVMIELKGMPMNDEAMLDMLTQYLLGLSKERANTVKASKEKFRRLKAKNKPKSVF